MNMEIADNRKSNEFECSIGKMFGRKYLNLHVRKHNVLDRKPSHMCSVCGKTFLVSGDLSAHIRQHNKIVETAPCQVCGKIFAIPGPLTDHMRVHTGERLVTFISCKRYKHRLLYFYPTFTL